MPDNVQRLRYFDHQFLREKDFTDEQAYHLDMRRTHNRLLHTTGVASGMALRLDGGGRRLTVGNGMALDVLGREIVLLQDATYDLGAYVGKTLWVTVAYTERQADPSSETGVQGNRRWEEVPDISLDETPPDDPGMNIPVGRVVVGADGIGAADEGEGSARRRLTGAVGGEFEARSISLTSDGGTTAQWPKLRMSADSTVELRGSLIVTENETVRGSLGVGTDPSGRLHVVDKASDSNGTTLVLGTGATAQLRLGYHADYSWIQSHAGKPLRINELGNDVLLAPNGKGNVGIGTPNPGAQLHVGKAINVGPWAFGGEAGAIEITGSGGELGIVRRNLATKPTAYSPGDRFVLYNQDGAAARLWSEGDLFAFAKDGSLGVGLGNGANPAYRLHVKGPGAIALFESTEASTYIRLAASDGIDNRVEFCNRGGGKLALWVAAGGDALAIARDGAAAVPKSLVVGAATGSAKLHVINQATDSSGTTMVLGPIDGSQLRLGYHTEYSWIQSHGSKPLRINELGNDVLLAPAGKSNVGIWTPTPRTALDTGLGVMSGAANDYVKAQFTLSGGGTVTWADGRLKWTNRFIGISANKGTTFSAGYVDIVQPTAPIPAANVYDGKDRSVTNGVQLNGWEALYAVHKPGGLQNEVTFQIRAYTADFNAPSNWLLVAVVNGDENSVKLGTGQILGKDLRWGNGSVLSTDQGGSIELGADNSTAGVGTPYIDFHYKGVQSDYSARIINDADGQLTLMGKRLVVGGDLRVTGMIQPSAGAADTNGILFPLDAFGGSGDKAYLRYYSRTAESCTLELGILNDGDDHIALMPSGNVGIGRNDPPARLTVRQPANNSAGGFRLEQANTNRLMQIYWEDNSNVVFYRENGVGQFMDVNGNWNRNSDASLKTAVAPLDDPLGHALRLRPVSFDWKHSGERDVGVIAQEVREVFPELVSTCADGTLGVAYDAFGVIAIAALKQLNGVVDEQRRRIDELTRLVAEGAAPA
ncbi:MAG TPA: tail fiber domain-containing protein [Longimicrobiaceae bacterium]|jgi:hypothetical protein|nr:tail fiber domain-containing protein [Longimicrobiaceae bacterium]